VLRECLFLFVRKSTISRDDAGYHNVAVSLCSEALSAAEAFVVECYDQLVDDASWTSCFFKLVCDFFFAREQGGFSADIDEKVASVILHVKFSHIELLEAPPTDMDEIDPLNTLWSQLRTHLQKYAPATYAMVFEVSHKNMDEQ